MRIPHYTKDDLARLPLDRRADLYARARAYGTLEGNALAKLIEDCGLPFSEATCPSDSDPLVQLLERIVFSEEGRREAMAAAERGLPAMAGIDPLLNRALKADYGKHNMTTQTAGDRVARLMRSLGYREAGQRPLPPGCVAKSATLWVRK